MKKNINIFKIIITFYFLSLNSTAFASFCDLIDDDNFLNRKAPLMNDDEKKHYSFVDWGFHWEEGDSNTTDWRPQGISVFSKKCNGVKQSWAAVTWYHTSYKGYKGVRLSLVNISNKVTSGDDSSYYEYRHILLKDADGRYLSGHHAGGLLYRQGKFFIPVKEKFPAYLSAPSKFALYNFNIDNIIESTPSENFNYGYTLQQNSYAFDSSPTSTDPFTLINSYYMGASFLSYDWDRELFLSGNYSSNCANGANFNKEANSGDLFHKSMHYDQVFNADENKNCTTGGNEWANRLHWISPNKNDTSDIDKITGIKEVYKTISAFTEMQGAAANAENLWTSSSHSRYRSHLHVQKISNFDTIANKASIFENDESSPWCDVSYPAGLEDLYITSTSSNIYTLTEFSDTKYNKDKNIIEKITPQSSKIFRHDKDAVRKRAVFRIPVAEITYDNILSKFKSGDLEENENENVMCYPIQ